MILFITPRRGRPPGYISATDLATFSVCPRKFVYEKIMGVHKTRAMNWSRKQHARKYKQVARRATKMRIENAIREAEMGKTAMGVEVEISGNGVYGLVDALILKPEKAIIIEYKSSLYPGAKAQARGYAYALRAHYGGAILMKIEHITSGRTLWYKAFDRDEESKTVALLHGFKSALERGTFPASPGTHCLICRIASACPFKKYSRDCV